MIFVKPTASGSNPLPPHSAPVGAGERLVELLRLTVVGRDGRDIMVACISCDSSDAGRVHQDSGVYYCYGCGKCLTRLTLGG